MANEKKILLKNVFEPEQFKLAAAEKRGAYTGIRKALGMDFAQVIEEMKKSELRGRGGAGFPTGVKWSFVPRNTGKPIYLVCNADESEPGTFKDRLLLESDPHLVIEGILCAAWALQCEKSFLYVRGEYAFPAYRMQLAIEECYAKGYLGKNIFGSNFSHDLILHRGAGAYVCGEESAMLESLEGKKGQPRMKPPFPAVSGLYGCPTVINNVETLCNVPWIINNGGEAFAAIGVKKSEKWQENSTGTKLVSASGHINTPGIYEIEMGYPLMEFLEKECGGVRTGHSLLGIIPGGSSVNVLTADECQGLNLDYQSMAAGGSSLGCAGFMVMDETTDVVEAVCNLAHFYAHESCGQCTPCREGGHWIEKIFRRIARGEGLPGDLELIDSVCEQIGGHTICAFGDTMIFPFRSFIKKFRPEFEKRIQQAGRKGLRVYQSLGANGL